MNAIKNFLKICTKSAQVVTQYLLVCTMCAAMRWNVKRFNAVPGATDSDGKQKSNSIVYHPCPTAKHNVVFFGGDIQNYPEEMLSHRDNNRHVKWNLETTTEIIANKFPDSNILVIKPSRMHLHTFAVFRNFVKATDFGNPEHDATYGGLKHLQALLMNFQGVITQELDRTDNCEVNNDCEQKPKLDSGNALDISLPIIVVGFSKGCIVLNQILYELASAREEPLGRDFVGLIKAMYWLDGGHSGGSNTWVTDEDVLLALKDSGIEVHVHVTPYQVKDPMRQWIKREKNHFVKKLGRLGINVQNTLHFSDEPKSLENHFNVLKVFR